MSPKGDRRSERVVGEITCEDLWLEVICLSNPEIAGSPRDIFRYSPRNKPLWGRATEWSTKRKRGGSIKLRIHRVQPGSQSSPDKRILAKGKHPRLASKVLK